MPHFEHELEELQNRLLEMAGLVESSIHRSVLSLTKADQGEAQQVLMNEARINQMEIDIDDLAMLLLARRQPMARDLRLLTSAIKINNDLERMGDLAVNIVERALSLMRKPPLRPCVDIPHMARLVQSMVRECLDAFVKRDAELARKVLLSDDAVDEMRDLAYRELTGLMERDSTAVSRALDLIFIARNLERIADHATNIAEDVLFVVLGVDVRHHNPGPSRETKT